VAASPDDQPGAAALPTEPTAAAPPVLVCVRTTSLKVRLEASLESAGYSTVFAMSSDEAAVRLHDGPKTAMIAETTRDGFAPLVRYSARLHPDMPVQLIESDAVFCFYPLSRQPFALIDAILAAGVSISPDLLRHTNGWRRDSFSPPQSAFLV
jgi:hypothetical protein